MNPVASPLALAAGLTEFWSPRVIGEVNDVYVKVAKVHGELVWHAYGQEDELFLVLRGRLDLEPTRRWAISSPCSMTPAGRTRTGIPNTDSVVRSWPAA